MTGQVQLPHDHGQSFEKNFDHMPDTCEFQTVSDIFKQLGDGSRIRIFWILCHCEECVMNLSALVDMSSPAVLQAASSILFAQLAQSTSILSVFFMIFPSWIMYHCIN